MSTTFEDSLYGLRIDYLQEHAELEKETGVNEPSKKDLLSFVGLINFPSMPNLILMSNGNLRLMWQYDDFNIIKIEFLGDKHIECTTKIHHNAYSKLCDIDDIVSYMANSLNG